MLCSDNKHNNKKEASDIVAINIVLQNNAFALFDTFEYLKNEECASAIETIYTASIVTCAHLIKSENLTMEDISNSLFELTQDMIKKMGSKEARRFSATIELSFRELKKSIDLYLMGMKDLDYFKELDLRMGKKNIDHV